MVCYVILRQFLREIPPKISPWNTWISTWLTQRRGHLRGVKIPDSEIWSPFSKYKQSIGDATHTVSDDYKPDFGSDNGNDWSDNDADNKNNEASHNVQNFNQISDTNHLPPQQDTWHIKTGKTHPSDTFPFTCTIISQIFNGLGGRNNNKLEK